jgi:hypothetical protein
MSSSFTCRSRIVWKQFDLGQLSRHLCERNSPRVIKLKETVLIASVQTDDLNLSIYRGIK